MSILGWRPTLDMRPVRPTGRRALAGAGMMAITLLLGTAAVAVLETQGIADASPVYLVAVVIVGSGFGTLPAVATAIIAFLVYDFLFTEPRFSLVVADAREWVDLVLFLFVALAIGRLVANQHARSEEAARRAAEANSLFALSRALAVAGATENAAPELANRLLGDARLERVLILAGPPGSERTIADTSRGAALASPAIAYSLVRTPGDEPARWVRTHAPTGRHPAAVTTERPAVDEYRVRIELGDVRLGTVVAVRAREAGPPTPIETRVLALAADQLASAFRRDDLRRAATDLEIARQGDVLKTALIDAVSHDLRTPLASIRATAGGLADPAVSWTDADRRAAASVIDAEATRLDRIVRGVLDLGRIASGALHPDLEPHEPWALVQPVVERVRPALGDRPLSLNVPAHLPPVLVDAALLDVVVTNLIDNAARHAPPPAAVRIHATTDPTGTWLDLTIEDDGPGVEPTAVPHLFERFWRADTGRPAARRGLGIGLSVVRGLVEAMGGSVQATPGPAGGFQVAVRLRTAPLAPGHGGSPPADDLPG